MINLFHKLLKRLLPNSTYRVLKFLRIWNTKYSYFRSIKSFDSSIQNSPVPWFTYPATEYLMQLNLLEKTLLEFGSGNSTIFWSQRVKKVISVEHNKTWFYKMYNARELVGVEYLLKTEGSSYEDVLDDYIQSAQILVVDGIRREILVSKLLDYVRQGAATKLELFILDNSDRYPDLLRSIREINEYVEVDFHGFGPINPYSWTTTVFLKRNISLEYINNGDDVKSLGSIE